jgi:hypothetical protein
MSHQQSKRKAALTHENQKRLALTAVPIAAYVVVMALVAAVWVKPPLLGWIGFGIVAVVGAALIIAGPALFSASRTNVPSTAQLRRREGVLVLADATCSGVQLSESIVRHVHGRDVEVQVVAPTLPDPAHYIASDEDAAHSAAAGRLGETLDQLKQAGIVATGSVGTDDPVQALADAVAVFPATELVIVTSTESHWLEEGVLARAHELVPSVELIVVPPVGRAENDRGSRGSDVAAGSRTVRGANQSQSRR